MAIRAGGMAAKRCRNAAGVVCSRDCSRIVPSLSSTHRWLCRSPRSMPTVSRVGPAPGLVGRVAFALTTLVVVAVAFVTAGLR